WNPRLEGHDRLRFVVNCLTRLRVCGPDGEPRLAWSGPPADSPTGLTPWFDVPGRASGMVRIVFGHWSSLGLLQRRDVLCLDTGCVWGRTLTAVRLDGPARVISLACRESAPRAQD